MKKIWLYFTLFIFSAISFFSSFWLTYADSESQANGSNGINMDTDCLQTAGCSLDIQQFLWFRKSSWGRTSTLLFVQDAILASTMLIWTIVTIAFIWSGILFILAGRKGDSSTQQKATKWIIYSIIGLILVICSYWIIRLIQYIAMT